MDVDHWPTMLRPLVREFGAKRVYEKGMEVLGFPPTWVHAAGEIAAMEAALGKRMFATQ